MSVARNKNSRKGNWEEDAVYECWSTGGDKSTYCEKCPMVDLCETLRIEDQRREEIATERDALEE